MPKTPKAEPRTGVAHETRQAYPVSCERIRSQHAYLLEPMIQVFVPAAVQHLSCTKPHCKSSS